MGYEKIEFELFTGDGILTLTKQLNYCKYLFL
jgi:hypothetical protein